MDGFLDRLRAWFTRYLKPPGKPESRRSRPLAVEALEERILPTLAPQAVFAQLADPAIQQIAKADYAAHQSITRSDMLAIFTQAETDHVISANEFSSMKTLVADATSIAMPGYVANLANKVVNGDPANKYFASTASPTGNLAAGCAASQLRVLVSDWFQGVNPVTAATGVNDLAWTSGTLFGKNGPQYTDIYQGGLGDCTLLASLAEVAIRRPNLIQNMFIVNSDGSVTVRLFRNGAPDYVTVVPTLPNAGQLYDRVTNGVLWAALVEKAMVQENESGWLQTFAPGSNSYAALNGGDPGTTVAYLSALTGLPSSYYAVAPSSIAASWQAGKFVVLATGVPPTGSGLISDHAYAMVAYNSTAANPYQLFNPWGITFGEVAVNSSMLTTAFGFTASAGAALDSHAPPVQETGSVVAASSNAVSSPPLTHPTASNPPALDALQDTPQDSPIVSHAAIDSVFATWGNLGEIAAEPMLAPFANSNRSH